ncbi:nucleotidyltransferase domain-containing protein [Jiangella anatolica]|uniref:Polymerase nucleotidyl transferase domain-containing protein n=1 Tax=Jiangella anatolica TaxID=2670374 RepID=A0A2W2BC50_9ACTN|nr:nucleotidyltransferase domain-containing protein [Jiangella anatolica]PZF83612.1 hypothetical protein C1I92_11795 [Jiangella anatolica]
MDVALPIRSVISTLDGPVLSVLARTTRPLTGREVQQLAGVGSPNGIRLALARLVHQGVVRADERAAAVFYQANRDHLAWPAVEILTSLRRTLLARLRAEFEAWQEQPTHASLFGSAARGDGDADSDIDILLVEPDHHDETIWLEQIDQLRQRVETWTGNQCQVYTLAVARLAEHVAAGDPLVDGWLRDSVALAGASLQDVVREVRRLG